LPRPVRQNLTSPAPPRSAAIRQCNQLPHLQQVIFLPALLRFGRRTALFSAGEKSVESGYYASFTALLAGTQALELAANNMANISTTGYKAQREFYSALTASLGSVSTRQVSGLNRAINDYAVLGGAAVDTQPGTLERTGNELDVALEGSGFFVVQTKAGLRYTRNGNFRLDANGQLVTAWGDPVMGDQGPMQIPSGPLSISPDGTISSEGAVVANLKISDFPRGTVFTPEGNSTYSAGAATPTPAADPRVREGMLEASNMSAIDGTIGLILIQRQAQLFEQALSIFHNDLDKSAADELPRVS
jgi:flagellar basal-body rod protein FlgF/flagellar basal-body rod protein FlgG